MGGNSTTRTQPKSNAEARGPGCPCSLCVRRHTQMAGTAIASHSRLSRSSISLDVMLFQAHATLVSISKVAFPVRQPEDYPSATLEFCHREEPLRDGSKSS